MVYRIRCGSENCSETYAGETKQALGSRMGQHKRPSTIEAQNSAVYNHLRSSGHSFYLSGVKILDKEENWVRRGLKKAVWERVEGPNPVPRSHSVTGNVRSGKVGQYTIFHWLLKKGCGNAIYAPIGLFRGTLGEGLVFASSCAVLNKCQLCGGKFCFSDAGKALQLRKIILKICDVCVNGTDERPTYTATRIKFCVACYAVRRN